MLPHLAFGNTEVWSVMMTCRVRTDMGMHAASEESQPEQSPEESVKKQLKLFDGMTLEGSGWYYQHTGEKLPY